MKLTSNYNVSDKIWFLYQDGKFYEGSILDITSWDKWNSFRYDVHHHGANEDITHNIEERNIYPSKNAILENCLVYEVVDEVVDEVPATE